ncbi:acetyl-CoA hydrolase/transferase C-terminal domain-containing protein [Sphingomonas sp. dw_22]|uniref:acetyl-CoA hydrolase/transferase family protein n=1 Tax=Sphingomonas sp. dw_22 TaxID=2721175 RepID=UPI0021163057|nr:acetyl-CoA hydrolase/transferase C-terminal domain-containing protein [Sphingomonas sp. dw_22]
MTISPSSAYPARRMPAQAAIALIPRTAKIAMGLGVSQPPLLLATLADRARQGGIDSAAIYYLLSTAPAASILRTELRDKVRPMSLFHSGIERALDKEAATAGVPLVDFIPTSFSQTPRVLCEQIDVDVLLTTVSPPDAEGWLSLGTNTDYALPVARTARQVIVEVNPAMPRVAGEGRIHIDQVTALVENHVPLTEIPAAAIGPEDRAIGEIIAGLAGDGDCLQMGIGALPDAVCAALRHHRGLGIHTELMTPGLAALMREGVIDNSRKTLLPGRAVFTFAMGDRALYDFLNDNPALESRPVDYVNDPAIIAANAQMLSVNATVQVDLQGACNSEFVAGRQFSAAGGQLDFVRGAYASKGGRSIIACHSTAAKGTVSRIVPRLDGPVTTPRNDTHIVVTEFGAANLKGKTLRERADALIAIAHPDFREELARAAHAAAMGG